MRRSRLEIDLQAITDNWRSLDSMSSPVTETGAVLKANAYGLGVRQIAPVLLDAGVQRFFVASSDEGVELRRILGHGPEIYVLAGLMKGEESRFTEFGLAPCLNSPDQIRNFAHHLPGQICAVQIDSGMNRLGIKPDHLSKCEALLAKLSPTLVMSHLAVADTPDHPLNDAQLKVFTAAARQYFPQTPRSLAATGGILLVRDYHFDLTRPGVGLFGGAPFTQARPVVKLSLPVIQVHDVNTGEIVGYGGSWKAEKPTRIATLAAGYADGLFRSCASGRVKLYADGVACPMVGRVSMDLITVDITGINEVPDYFEILNEHQGIDDLASAAGTIGYEILTSLGGRYERVYKAPDQQSE